MRVGVLSRNEILAIKQEGIHMRSGKSICGGLAAIGLALFATAGFAQGYAAKAITFVYPYAPGSNADSSWRILGQEVGRTLGQTVVHENRPGAGGRVGLDALMRAPADGYTIGMFNNVLGVWQPLMDQKLAIEPVKDYTPVSLTIETPLVLTIRPGLPFRDLRGLIAYGKSNPGKLNGSSPGPGTGGHLAIALLSSLAAIQITHVPYKGAAPSLTALLGGESDLTFIDGAVKPHIDSGKAVGLMVGGNERWPLLPQVPTAPEAGLPAFRVSSWNGVVGPAGIPEEVREKLTRAFNDAANAPDVKAKLLASGWVIRAMTSQGMAQTIRADMDLFRPVIRDANIKLDQ